MVDPDRAIGKRIEALRTAWGLSQDQMSERLRAAGLNWSQVTLSKVEAGQRPTKFSEILTLADLFSVEIAELSPDGGGFAYQYHKVRQDRDNAAERMHEAERALEKARHWHRQLSERTARLRLAMELASGQRGPYRVNEDPMEFLHHLHAYLWPPTLITPQKPADEADALGVLEQLGVDEATIADARTRVSADVATVRADLENGNTSTPFPDYVKALDEPWESASGDIPHPSNPMFEEDMQGIEDHFTTAMAVRILAERFPYVRFTTPDWDTSEDAHDRPPVVQGLITDD
ncbi:helix-turn-helix domain-containing protein [Nocardia sp. CDC159]|uniref:Helix-turn-helix domain-containing protein n=1 Tax=Nocardia pulmonis TaxID=2951408 RepID=A0A9X2E1Z4_9NOCA|nr:MULTISPECIES: helix-turn-helix transcriptional regulator [Nocardia]MCM6772754.1 helix-turn-helix domain-containing protein [Nocardia pulmonis]MCM6785943.1 helix-turn-helix domain-containing protein [Nocardia sp. CDC159]